MSVSIAAEIYKKRKLLGVDMLEVLKIAMLALLLIVAPVVGATDDISREKIKGLDEQVQDIKTDVLAISTELMQLEEKLLYPSNAHVSLFVSAAVEEKIRLDAVDIFIDGQEVTHHVYTHKELTALQGGGVQRIYTGNLRSGEHELKVVLSGKTSSADDFQESATYKFTKEVGPSLVEIKLFGSDNTINFKDH